MTISRAFELSLFEPKSPFPGNGIFRAETKRPEKALNLGASRCGDKAYSSNPVNSGLVAENGEISVRTRMRGGAERRRHLS